MTVGLSDLLLAFDRDAVLEIVERQARGRRRSSPDTGRLPAGHDLVGERFRKGDFFLADLIVSAEIFKEVTTVIEPHLSRAKSRPHQG